MIRRPPRSTRTEILFPYTTLVRSAGIPAKMVCSATPDAERNAAIRAFRERRLLRLVNVDLFGEGFDVPAIEVGSFARPTQSFAVYAQQLDRKSTRLNSSH